MTEYANFRQGLDAVLRTLDVKQVSEFLIAEGQWERGAPADPEFAMWMMIIGSSALEYLHERARLWLMEHGHEAEARAVQSKGSRPGSSSAKGGQQSRGGQRGKPGGQKGQQGGQPYRGAQSGKPGGQWSDGEKRQRGGSREGR